MVFRNRKEAATLLAQELRKPRGADSLLVLAIPRGAVLMGRVLADALGGELDVVLVHKIGAPGNPEYAVGAVSEFEDVYLTDAVDMYSIPQGYIDHQVKVQIEMMKARRKLFTPGRPPLDPRGRTAVIVDDGIATGSTMLVAAHCVRARGPSRLIVASPVASQSAVSLIRKEVDEVVVLDVPTPFMAVSQFYEEFAQVSDDEVKAVLKTVGE